MEFGVLSPGDRADAYFGLLFALEDLFRRHIDLVEMAASDNPYFLKAVSETRTPLYAA